MAVGGMILSQNLLSTWSTNDSANMPNRLCNHASSKNTCKALHSCLDDQWNRMKTDWPLTLP